MPNQKEDMGMSMADFFTRGPSNEGSRLYLETPDGKKTNHWILVRGVNSDAFRKAEAKANLSLVLILQKEKREREALGKKFKPDYEGREKNRLELIASLVADWSLKEECNEANVIQLFKEAPNIKSAVDSHAGEPKNFFVKPSKTS